jgi:hypothetical protein
MHLLQDAGWQFAVAVQPEGAVKGYALVGDGHVALRVTIGTLLFSNNVPAVANAPVMLASYHPELKKPNDPLDAYFCIVG